MLNLKSIVNSLFKSKKYMENIYDQQLVAILISPSVKSYIRFIRSFNTWIIPLQSPINFQIIITLFIYCL